MIVITTGSKGTTIFDDCLGDDDVIIYDQKTKEIHFHKKMKMEDTPASIMNLIVRSLCQLHNKKEPENVS